MSALGTLAAGVTGGIWKIAAVVLLAALLVVGAWAGGGWFLAARDRDPARVELATEREAAEQLRASIREQNRAVEAAGAAKLVAEARGQAAQQQAAAAGRRSPRAPWRRMPVPARRCWPWRQRYHGKIMTPGASSRPPPPGPCRATGRAASLAGGSTWERGVHDYFAPDGVGRPLQIPGDVLDVPRSI